ncbi:hypothetical protein NUACC21_00110 [Scytonema sp. NUACC21]
MGSDRNKLLLMVKSRPIIAWTLLAAEVANLIEWIGIISHPDDWQDFQSIIDNLNLTKPVELIKGGSTQRKNR